MQIFCLRIYFQLNNDFEEISGGKSDEISEITTIKTFEFQKWIFSYDDGNVFKNFQFIISWGDI